MKRYLRGVSVVGVAGLVAGLLSVVGLGVVAGPAAAGISSAACAFADSETATECVISSAWTSNPDNNVALNHFPGALPGPGVNGFVFHKTLHITPTGSINASTAGAPGITLTIDNVGFPASAGALVMDDAAALIDTSDVSGNDNAGPITVTASGGAQLASGSVVTSENNSLAGNGGAIGLTLGASSSFAGTISSQSTTGQSGNGGKITIGVTGNLTLASTAVINSEKDADSGTGGDIVITVSGDMTMQGTLPAGALITSRSSGVDEWDAGRQYHDPCGDR